MMGGTKKMAQTLTYIKGFGTFEAETRQEELMYFRASKQFAFDNTEAIHALLNTT